MFEVRREGRGKSCPDEKRRLNQRCVMNIIEI